jgi:putative cell wall-binding protein
MTSMRAARALLGGAVAGAVAVAGLATASPAAAAAEVETPRVAGADRFATSAEVSESAFPQGSSSVVIASGFSFADGLAASALAGHLDAPVLLVPPIGSLPTSIRNELSRLGAGSARIVGGVGAVSPAVADEIEGRGLTVTRSGGDTRYDTAALVASRIGRAGIGMFDGLRTAIVATGTTFPDALAASAPAFSGPHPILLTEPNRLPTATRDALVDLDVEQVLVMGGTAAVSPAVVEAIRSTGEVTRVERVAGADRGATAHELADLLVADPPDGFGYGTGGAVVASGNDFADALSAGPLAGGAQVPILFASPTTTAAAAFLAAHKATIARLTVIGGTAAVTSGQVATLADAATQPSNQTYAMTPQASTRWPSVAYSSSRSATYIEYRATGIPSRQSSVAIALAQPSAVSISSGGIVTFAKATGTPVRAELSNARVGDLRIHAVNGAGIAPATFVANAPVRNGAVSFRVAVSTDASIGEAIPVLYAPNSGNLLVGNDGRPTGGFAIGGEIEVVPPEAAANTIVTATAFSLDGDSFVGALTATTGRVFHLRNGDDYRIAGVGGTSNANRNTFLNAFSVGDAVAVQYNQQRSHSGAQVDNRFDLVDDLVAAPTNVAASLVDSDASGSSDTVRLTFNAPRTGLQTASGATVRRYPVTNGVVGSVSTDSVVSWSYTSGTGGQLTMTGSAFPPIGRYVFRIALKGVTGASYGELSAASGSVQISTTPLFGAASAPFANVIAVSDSGSNGLSSSDVITVTFNEPMQLTAGTDSVTIADADTSGTLTEGANATFTVGGADRNVLTIAVTGPPVLTPLAGNVAYGANTKLTAVSSTFRDRDASLAWDPTAANKLGKGGLPLGVSTVPGSTPVPPFTLTGAADAVGSTGTITLNPVTRVITGAPGAAVPGATVFVSAISNGTAADAGGARRSTAAANGSFTITLTTAQTNTAVTLRQEVQRTAATMLTSDPSASIAAQPVLLATSALGGGDGEVEDGDTVVLQLSAAVPTAGLTSFDVTISNAAPNVVTIAKAGDLTAAGVVATVTTTGVQYNTGPTPMTFTGSTGVWTNGGKTLTITLDNLAGGTAATGVVAHTSSFVAGPALKDAGGVSIDATPVIGASSRF